VLCAATHGVPPDEKMSHTPLPVFPPVPPPGPTPPESTAPPSPAPLDLETELLGAVDPSVELPEAPDPSVELPEATDPSVELLPVLLVPVLLGDSDVLDELLGAPPDDDDATAELGLLDAPLDPDGPLEAPELPAAPELPEVSEPPELVDAGAADGAGLDEHALAKAAEMSRARANPLRRAGSPGLDARRSMIRTFM
jgi:hypothetical protein